MIVFVLAHSSTVENLQIVFETCSFAESSEGAKLKEAKPFEMCQAKMTDISVCRNYLASFDFLKWGFCSSVLHKRWLIEWGK